MPLCIDVEGDDELRRYLPNAEVKRKEQNGFLEWPVGECLFVLSVPFIFQLWVYLVWFHPIAKILELREAGEWCQTTGAEARAVGKGLVCLQCQYLGLVGIEGEVHWGHCTVDEASWTKSLNF